MEMPNKEITGRDLMLDILPSEQFEILTNPESDPALALSDFTAKCEIAATIPASIPSIESIEAALNDHVGGGAAPYELIQNIFHPLVGEITYIDCYPGKGQKRPSYALEMQAYGVKISRRSTRSLAEYLHAKATDLAKFPIGDRAPKNAPTLGIEARTSAAFGGPIFIKAADPRILKSAHAIAFGRPAGAIHIPLDYSCKSLLPHILAAREIIERETAGAQHCRQQAIDLIRATQDLRATASTALKCNPDVTARWVYRITIRPRKKNPIDIQDQNSPRTSSHSLIQFAKSNTALSEALSQVIDRHPVLKQLPKSLRITLNGNPDYLHLEIIDDNMPQYSRKATIPAQDLEYVNITKLAEHLSSWGQEETEDSYWSLSFSGQSRIKSQWTVAGPTFSQAIARNIQDDTDRVSSVLMDLVINTQVGALTGEISVEVMRLI